MEPGSLGPYEWMEYGIWDGVNWKYPGNELESIIEIELESEGIALHGRWTCILLSSSLTLPLRVCF